MILSAFVFLPRSRSRQSFNVQTRLYKTQPEDAAVESGGLRESDGKRWTISMSDRPRPQRHRGRGGYRGKTGEWKVAVTVPAEPHQRVLISRAATREGLLRYTGPAVSEVSTAKYPLSARAAINITAYI